LAREAKGSRVAVVPAISLSAVVIPV